MHRPDHGRGPPGNEDGRTRPDTANPQTNNALTAEQIERHLNSPDDMAQA